jgi:glycosyltransferase involved in cell wall biosynthesis
MSEGPLKVAVDARCLNVDHLRGMGKSLFELVRRTAASGAIEWHLLADRPDRPMQVPSGVMACEVFETRGSRVHSWEQWSLPRRARQLKVDLLHAPGTTLPWWQPVPTVVTLHDTIPWQGQHVAFPAGFYRDRLLPSAYHRSSAVVTVSDCSRRDILARWPQLQTKLHVVSPGVDERYLAAEPDGRPVIIDEVTISRPYLLYLGGADPRKRLMWAIQTWLGLTTPDVMLVCCGLDAAGRESVRAGIPRERQGDFVAASYISEPDMPHVYMRASAVLYPSLYEGFGLPVIEAHAVGTPILFSDVGSLSELKGPGAVVLTVDDLAAWVRAVDGLLSSEGSRAKPDRIARAWARQYSWEAFTDRMLSAYRVAAKRQPKKSLSREGVPGASR